MLNLIPFPQQTEILPQTLAGKLFIEDENLLFYVKQNGKVKINYVTKKDICSQGYEIIVNGDGVKLFYSDDDGKFYGTITLIQLCDGTDGIPYCHIQDYPVSERRGVQLCFGQFDLRANDEWINKFLRDMAFVKINEIMLYLEWNYCVDGLPLFPYGIKIEQVKEWEKTAEKYHIRILPAVNLLGHSSEVLSYEAMTEIGESASAFCPSNPKTLLLAEKVVNELSQLKSPIIHVGGDEVGAYGKCPECKTKYEKNGKLGLFLEYFGKINEMLKNKNKKMGLWSDQLLMLMDGARFWTGCDVGEKYREKDFKTLYTLKDNLIVYDWWYNGQNDDACRFYEKHGIEYYACGATGSFNTSAPSTDLFNNLYNFYAFAQRHNCCGVMTTDWQSVSGNHPELYGVTFAAGASIGWCGGNNGFVKGQTKDCFLQAYSVLRYGVKSDKLVLLWKITGDVFGELLSLLPDKCKGWSLRNDMLFTNNPLYFYNERRNDWKKCLADYGKAVEKCRKLFNGALKEQDGREPYFEFVEFPLLAHEFIYNKINILDNAFEIYHIAAQKQFKSEEFSAELDKCAAILQEFIGYYDIANQYVFKEFAKLGGDEGCEKRVGLQKNNYLKLIDFIIGLKDNRRLLPSLNSITKYLFDVCDTEVYAALSYEWSKDGYLSVCKHTMNSFCAADPVVETLRGDFNDD